MSIGYNTIIESAVGDPRRSYFISEGRTEWKSR
nr:MAG TPA: hypothetical protein [Caudoviricetes sp.]DAG39373.1 MAG TPA: hypothetical protein [Caudoviricetes sp.]DAP69628.1 MAG TPA: hypothetical protein [Caudoviricetes sp.]DAR04949.1 MAG TPA: hypothetical protein [Caudoviricetes sp.]